MIDVKFRYVVYIFFINYVERGQIYCSICVRETERAERDYGGRTETFVDVALL